MDTRLNISTQTEQVEFIPIALCHDQFIEYRHYCLSLARPNDMKIIIVQECHGLIKLESANILFNRRIQGNMGSLLDNNNAYESHSTISSWSTPWYDSINRKEVQRNTLKYF